MMVLTILVLGCALWTVEAYPYYPYYGNIDSLSLGASDSSRGGLALSRYYNPYYTQRAGGGTAAFMFRQPEEQPVGQHYLPNRLRQPQPDLTYLPPQQNEVFYPQTDKPATEPTELEPTERTELPTTAKTIPEITEPEIEEVEEPVQKPKKRLQRKKQVKRPVEDEEEDDGYDMSKMPAAAFFPMFFGYGGRSGSGGMPGGATAVANAYSTGRGGVASSHATAYGAPRPDSKL